MKKNLFVLFLLSNFAVFAQNPDANTEAYVTYGSNFFPFNNDNNDDRFIADEDKFTWKWPVNYSKPDGIIASDFLGGFFASGGNITVGYNIRKGNHVVGGMINFERQLLTQKSTVDNEVGPVAWSDSSMKNWSLAGRYHYNWINKEKLKMYSGLSAGAGIRSSKTEYFYLDENKVESNEILENFYTDKTNEFIFHLHANAVGLRYGTDWALILELGMGTRGFVNVGINHHLFASDKWIK